MAYKPPIHGRDHCIGGADPIPCFPGGYMRRARQSGTQSIPGNSAQTVITYTAADDITDAADRYTAVTVDGFDAGIRVERDGMYHILCRVACGSLVTEFAVALWGIDPAPSVDFFSYQNTISTLGASTELTGFVSTVVRLGANQTIFATIRQNSGSSATIAEGTFLELNYMGPATLAGRTW